MNALTPALIASVVADALGFTVDDLRIRDRHTGRSRARHLAWFVTVELTPASYAELGELYQRDPKAVYYGVRVVGRKVHSDTWTRETVAALMARAKDRAR